LCGGIRTLPPARGLQAASVFQCEKRTIGLLAGEHYRPKRNAPQATAPSPCSPEWTGLRPKVDRLR